MKATPVCDFPVILTIAGSDCSSGAGLQADMKAAHALGAYALTAVTCVVSEIPGHVSRIQEVPVEMVADQVKLLLDTYPVGAVKTGMLYSPEIVRTVSRVLRSRNLPLVVDPVMIATSGDPLMKQEALKACEEALLPLATLVTPNMDETAVLWGRRPVTADDNRQAALELARRYGTAFLVKGGHLHSGEDRVDVLGLPDGSFYEWCSDYVEDVTTHGTGCTYSAAIAAGLARGLGLRESVSEAHAYVARAIRHSFRWEKRGLNAPPVEALNHFA